MKPISKHKWLWYCLECGTLIQSGGLPVIRWFYVCSPKCKEMWFLRPDVERAGIIKQHVKDNSNG